MAMTKELVEEFEGYFDIFKKYKGSNENDLISALELDLNIYLETLSKKYEENWLWDFMTGLNSEQAFYVASAVLCSKHSLVIKVLKDGDWVTTKFVYDPTLIINEKEKKIDKVPSNKPY